MGFGAVRCDGNRMKALDYGTITSPAGMPVPERLAILFRAAREIIARVKPGAVAVEELFFSRNVKTAMVVAQARGVVLLACGLEGVPVYEVKPGAVKMAVTGYGRAEKGQVQRMVRLLLGLAEDPKPDDTADALAVAIAHAQYPAAALAAREVSTNKVPSLKRRTTP